MAEGQQVDVLTGKSEAGKQKVTAVITPRTAEATQKPNDQLNSSEVAALHRAAEAARRIRQQGGGGS